MSSTRARFVLVFSLLASASPCIGYVHLTPIANDTNSQSAEGPGNDVAATPGTLDQDRWSMVASMRDGGPQHHSTSDHRRVPTHRKSTFDWNVNLDPLGRYQLNWDVNYGANQVSFALEINTNKSNFQIGSDIFALGFSQRGELKSSDFCLIWFDLSHGVHLQDAHTDSNNVLRLVASSKSVCKPTGHTNRRHRRRRQQQQQQQQQQSSDRLDWSEDADYDRDVDGIGPPGANEEVNLDKIDRHEEEASRAASDLRQLRQSNYEIMFKRPLEVCGQREHYYAIDNGTTHLVWFALKGPVLQLDGLNLTEYIRRAADANQRLPEQQQQQQQQGDERNQHRHATGENWPTGNESKLSQAPPSTPPPSPSPSPQLNFEFGLRRAQLIASKPARSSSLGNSHAAADRRQLEIRMDRYEVPARETTYWCKLFKLPERFESKRFHVTSYEAAIEPGMEHVVHHMELFNCANLAPGERGQLERLYHSRGGWAGECSSSARPRETNSCKRVILAWAMGAKALVYPEQVGQSIGGPNYSPFVVLEVHYNNVERARGLLDSSGLRFHYTGRLRPFDAGILEVGLEYTDKNSIPPGLVAPLAGHCVSECTRVALAAGGGGGGRLLSAKHRPPHHEHRRRDHQDQLDYNSAHDEQHDEQRQQQQERDGPKEEGDRDLRRPVGARETDDAAAASNTGQSAINDGSIYIFAAQMHTHLTGVASWTEHVREGRLLGELQRDDHYSPHFQEIRLLPRQVRVAPGDALVHYCLYDTRQRQNITLGGFGTADEMCVTYLHYYPRVDLEVCKSSVDSAALAGYFERLARDEAQGTRASRQTSSSSSSSPSQLPPLEAAARGEEEEEEKEEEGLNSRRQDQGETSAALGAPSEKSVSENYRAIEWSARRSRELIEFYHKAPLAVQCNRSDGRRWPGFWAGQPPTRLVRDPARQRAGGPPATASQPLEPLDSDFDYYKQPSAGELVAYRGLGHGARHARCQRAAPGAS